LFHFKHVFSGGDLSAVGETEDMGIHCHSYLAEGSIKNHIRGLATNTRLGF